MSDLVKQGRFVANFLHSDDVSSVMHAMTVNDLCDRIEELERELASMTTQADAEALYSDGLRNQLAAEKELADRLWRIVKGKSNADEVLDTCDAYRKARGM